MAELELNAKVMEQLPNTVVVTVSGFLDTHTTPQLKALLDKLFEREKMNVILNLSGLLYISSTGIGALMKGLNLAEEKAGSFRLCEIPEKIFEIISMLGFDQVLSIYDTEEEAIRTLPHV